MAFADITLNDGQGTPVAHTFTVISTKDGRVVRSDLAAPPEEPFLMTMAHNQKTVSGQVQKGHLVRWDKTVLDADGVTPHPNNIRIAADIRNAVCTQALAADFAAMIRNWATAENVYALFKDSVG